MKQFDPHEETGAWNYNYWFTVDQEDFEGEWKVGQVKTRHEKNIGQDDQGRIFIQDWLHGDKFVPQDFTVNYYQIDIDEFIEILDRAIEQGSVAAEEREDFIELANTPVERPWDIYEDKVVYQDDRFTLGQQGGTAYLDADGKHYKLTSHPYEPCLYITDENETMTAVHNAFDPFFVLESFSKGATITSITGFEYDPKTFCEMVAFAADQLNIGIDDAEGLFKLN